MENHHIQQVQSILYRIKAECIRIFQDHLTGIYVHGSFAFGCFCWKQSDIDFIIVTKTIPTLEEKEQLIAALLEIDKNCPPKGLEMSLVLEKYCHNFIYPTPFELHFSNGHKESCKENIRNYCECMNGTDKDLAAHFTVIRQTGITLYGQSIENTFGPVSKEYYMDSIRYDIENAAEEIMQNPVYYILNLCRVLAYIQDDTVLSKAQGAVWGQKYLPVAYQNIITAAGDCYISQKSFPANIDENALITFAQYMLAQIFPQIP